MTYQLKRKRIDKNIDPEGQEPAEPEKRKKRFLLILLLILLASNLFLFMKLMSSRKTVMQQQQLIAIVEEPPDASSEIAGKWYGLCSKNTVHSIADFKKTVANDDVLLNHFSDFNWDNARMGKLEKSAWTHLAYRKNGRISTTRKLVRLPKGDGYITDGRRSIRTFCCNDYVIAEAAAAPDRDKNQEIAEVVAAPDRDPYQIAKEQGLVGKPDHPENTVPRAKTDDTVSSRKTENSVVPEPSTLILLGAGMTVFGVMSWRRRSRYVNT